MTSKADVLTLLKRRRRRGVSAKHFPRGTRLAARIYDLRLEGYEIETIKVRDRCCRYLLRGEA